MLGILPPFLVDFFLVELVVQQVPEIQDKMV